MNPDSVDCQLNFIDDYYDFLLDDDGGDDDDYDDPMHEGGYQKGGVNIDGWATLDNLDVNTINFQTILPRLTEINIKIESIFDGLHGSPNIKDKIWDDLEKLINDKMSVTSADPDKRTRTMPRSSFNLVSQKVFETIFTRIFNDISNTPHNEKGHLLPVAEDMRIPFSRLLLQMNKFIINYKHKLGPNGSRGIKFEDAARLIKSPQIMKAPVFLMLCNAFKSADGQALKNKLYNLLVKSKNTKTNANKPTLDKDIINNWLEWDEQDICLCDTYKSSEIRGNSASQECLNYYINCTAPCFQTPIRISFMSNLNTCYGTKIALSDFSGITTWSQTELKSNPNKKALYRNLREECEHLLGIKTQVKWIGLPFFNNLLDGLINIIVQTKIEEAETDRNNMLPFVYAESAGIFNQVKSDKELISCHGDWTNASSTFIFDDNEYINILKKVYFNGHYKKSLGNESLVKLMGLESAILKTRHLQNKSVTSMNNASDIQHQVDELNVIFRNIDKQRLFIVNMCCVTTLYIKMGYVGIDGNSCSANFLTCWKLQWFKRLYLISGHNENYWKTSGKTEVCEFLNKKREIYIKNKLTTDNTGGPCDSDSATPMDDDNQVEPEPGPVASTTNTMDSTTNTMDSTTNTMDTHDMSDALSLPPRQRWTNGLLQQRKYMDALENLSVQPTFSGQFSAPPFMLIKEDINKSRLTELNKKLLIDLYDTLHLGNPTPSIKYQGDNTVKNVLIKLIYQLNNRNFDYKLLYKCEGGTGTHRYISFDVYDITLERSKSEYLQNKPKSRWPVEPIACNSYDNYESNMRNQNRRSSYNSRSMSPVKTYSRSRSRSREGGAGGKKTKKTNKKKKSRLKKKTKKKHKKKYNGGRTVRTKRTGQNHKKNEKTKKKNNKKKVNKKKKK